MPKRYRFKDKNFKDKKGEHMAEVRETIEGHEIVEKADGYNDMVAWMDYEEAMRYQEMYSFDSFYYDAEDYPCK